MLASWGTFLKRWICLLGTADSFSSFPFLSSFLFSSFPLSFSFVFIQIENKENKAVLNFYFSPVKKSFRTLSSQSLLLCTLTAQKETAIPIHFESTDFFLFFFLEHYFICAFLSFALTILQYCRDISFPSCAAIGAASALAVWIVEICNHLTVRGCWWLAGGLKMEKV